MSAAENTSMAVLMPDEITAGDLLIMFVGYNNAIPLNASGWTDIFPEITPIADDYGCYGRIAVGDEDSTLVTVGKSGYNYGGTAQVFCITNWFGTSLTNVRAGTSVTTAAATSLATPSVTWSWGASDLLFIAFLGVNDPSDDIITDPAGYTDPVKTRSMHAGVRISISTARRTELAGTTPESGGTFSWPSSQRAATNLLAIRGVTSGAGTGPAFRSPYRRHYLARRA